MPPEPRFSEPLHVGRPNIGDRAALTARIDGALDRRWLSNGGPLVREFEERVATVAGTRHAVATCNATSGLQIVARACGIAAGDEVIVPAFTWVATPHAFDWLGAVPVFCDVDEETGGADPAHVARLVTPRTRGIVGVHVFGRPCDVEGLSQVARAHGIPLLFDAAHAFGCTHHGVPIGGFGVAEVFSFHATKFVNTFEGGAIVTNDDELAGRARAMRNMGIADDREVVSSGTVARMSEIAAAMGLTSLDAMDAIVAVNRRNQALYERGLSGTPGVRVRAQAPGERANHQYLVIEVDAAGAGVTRDQVFAALYRHNVLGRRYFHPGCHQIEPYRSDPGRHAPLPLPRTEALADRVLALPTGTAIGPAEIAAICEIVRDTVTTGRRRPAHRHRPHRHRQGGQGMQYGTDHAELYDVVYRSRGKNFTGEATRLAELIRSRLPGARSLLDVACGTGAHLETFAGLFDHVEGADVSPHMLAVARRRLPDVPLHEADMRHLSLARTFDAVTCMGNAVACMPTIDELAAAVDRMAAHLVSGGVLVVEPWFFPDNFIDGHVAGHTMAEDGRVVSRVTRSVRDGDHTRHEVRFVVADAAGIRDFTEVLTVSLFTREQYVAALERAGCAVEMAEGFSLENGRPNSPGLFIATRK